MNRQPSTASDTSPGLLTSLSDLAKNMFGLLISRIELAALELAEVRTNLLKLMLIFACGIVAAWFALAYWTVVIVWLAWPVFGWSILLLLAAVFTLLAIGIFVYVQSMLKRDKLSLSATMTELRNDRDALL